MDRESLRVHASRQRRWPAALPDQRDGAVYGYQIIREIERRSQGYLTVQGRDDLSCPPQAGEPGAHPGEWSELPNGQQRRCYSITEKGRKELKSGYEAWEGIPNALNLISSHRGLKRGWGKRDVARGWELSA